MARGNWALALQGLGAGLSGQGSQWMYNYQRQQAMEAEEKRRLEAERKARTDATKAQAGRMIRTARKEAERGNVGGALTIINDLKNGIPGAGNSDELLNAEIALQGMRTPGPVVAPIAKRNAINTLRAMEAPFIGAGMLDMEETARSNLPAGIREWEIVKTWPQAEQDRYWEAQQAARLQSNAAFRGAVRDEEQRDLEQLGPVETEILTDRTTQVGGAETLVQVDRERQLMEDEAEFETAQAEPAARAAAENAEFDMARMSAAANEVRALANEMATTGFWGARASGIEGTPSYTLRSKLRTMEAYAGFSRLQAMRDASPTGGALGQVSERELALLVAAYAALDPNMDKDAFLSELQKFEAQVERSWANVARVYEETYGVPYSNEGPIRPTQQPGQTNLDRLMEQYGDN